MAADVMVMAVVCPSESLRVISTLSVVERIPAHKLQCKKSRRRRKPFWWKIIKVKKYLASLLWPHLLLVAVVSHHSSV